MILRFSLDPGKFQQLGKLPGAWGTKQFSDLLALMEYQESEELAQDELQELCYMALADLGEDEAAILVLTYLLTGRLNKGQIENLAQEILVEKLWEDFADLSLHETLFNAHQLLYDAFNGKFPKPEALRFEVVVSALNPRDLQYFSGPSEPSLIRLLVQGMPSTTKIARLYEDELSGGPFDDAHHILWQLQMREIHELSVIFEAFTSPYWFGDLKQSGSFSARVEWDPPQAGSK
jgi:hypothetical protein